ncbi:MAG: J domain-containing protein [Wolbachia sp.]
MLGINGKLIQRKINKAYRKLAFVYHPDKCNRSCQNSSNSNMQALS